MTEERRCPYCKDQTYMEYVDGTASITDWREMRAEGMFQCAGCKRHVIGGRLQAGLVDPYEPNPALRSSTLHEYSPASEIALHLVGQVEYWEPTSPVGKTYDPDIPASIAAPADEAHRCYSIGAFRAAVLMARGVIEAIAKEKGITQGRLVQKIDDLAEKKFIRPVLRDSAHEVRHIGNDMAHGDFASTDIGEDDALDVLEIMDDIIDEVLVMDARARRRKARRTDADLST